MSASRQAGTEPGQTFQAGSGGPASDIASQQPEPAVRLEDLGMRFGAGATAVEALKGVNAAIPAGQITGLVGPDAAARPR